MKTKPEDSTGRVVIDDRGRSIWQSPLDAAQLKALGEGLHLEGENSAAAKREKRRTLDDMRMLSEQIKTSKVWFRVPKGRRGGSST